MHFFEALERKIDYQKEFTKIEDMVIKDPIRSSYSEPHTVHAWMALYFRNWKKRGNYTTIEELRKQLGFQFEQFSLGYNYAYGIDINRFFLYCEMIINLFIDLRDYASMGVEEQMKYILETIEADVELSGFEIREIDDCILIVEKNAAAIEVADIFPEIADVIIEYNHYLLKGNLSRKKELLKKIADALEPERKTLEKACPQETKDFFFMVNNMDIRHNNCDSKDTKRFCNEFAFLSDEEKESWYDKIYEQALAITIIRDQKARTVEIANFKSKMQ